MYKLITVLLLTLSVLADTSSAQLGATENYCERCRNPYEYPNDYVNFAYDQIYGNDGWMDFDQADDFYITNPDGYVVYADVDFIMQGLELFGLSLPMWPTNVIQITLALPNGTMYTTRRSVFHRTLPVPTSQDPAPGDPSGTDNDGDNEGVDDLSFSRIRYADSGGLADGGVRGKHLLDLKRVELLSGDVDLIIDAVKQIEVAVLVHVADVPRT